MIRIALSGKMGAGKSTTAALISEWFDIPIMSFADGFRNTVTSAGITKENNEELYRRLCQGIGEGMRRINPDIWVDALDQRMRAAKLESCVIDDMRYPNELFWCQEHEFLTVRLEVPEAIRSERRIIIDSESETALDDYVDQFDLVLDDHTKTQQQNVIAIVQHILAEAEATVGVGV